MTRSAAQNSRWARILVFAGLALWLLSLFVHAVWMVVIAAVFTLVGAAVYFSRLRSSGDIHP